MNKEELELLRAELLAERDRLVAQLHYMDERRTGSELSDYTMHLADAGSDHAERETSAQLSSAERERLKSIDSALERLERGRYGVCADCGEGVGVRRLLAMPDAMRCIGCQEREERAAAEGGA